VVTLNAFGDTLIVWLKLFACVNAPLFQPVQILFWKYPTIIFFI
jgi:hypothetical protein